MSDSVSGRLFRPLVQNDHDMPYVSAFTFCRTGELAVFPQAIPRAFVTPGSPFHKYGALIKIRKSRYFQGHGGFAGMVEQKETGHQFFEVGLVPHQLDAGVG